MKIAHTVRYSPGKSGLYETTREIVSAEIAAGHDSRAVDPRVDTEREDRGVSFVSRDWMEEADILVNHEGVGRNPDRLPPIVSMLHGKPEYCFAMEHYQGIMLWRTVAEFVASDRVGAFVTWEQNIPGWELLVPREKLFSVSPCVDMEFWSPVGSEWDYASEHKNIVITDRWRPTKHSFGLLAGFARYADENPDVKLHIYASPQAPGGPLDSVLRGLTKRGILGEVRGEVSVDDLRAIYRTADLVLTSDGGTARTIREAMACGCPLVTGLGSSCHQVEVDTGDATAIAMGMHAVLGHPTLVSQRQATRSQAETLFDPTKTIEGLQAVYERVLKGL